MMRTGEGCIPKMSRFKDVTQYIREVGTTAISALPVDRELRTIYGVRAASDLDILLADLPRRIYDTACKAQWFHWKDYRLQYIPGKYLTIQTHGRGIKINVWTDFLEGTDPEQDAAAYMESCADIEHDIYDLCGGLEWHLAPMKWHSIAARSELFLIAEKLLEQYRVHQGLTAYYGPRIEQGWQGIYEGPLWHYDIHAAYPYAMSQIKSFRGPMQPTDRIVPGTYGFYLCRWDLRFRDHAYYPFPVRRHLGDVENLIWPAIGQAWISCFELEAYTAIYGWQGIQLIRGYAVQHEDHDCKYQADLRSVYAMRLERPSVFIKKFMALMYGKTIQHVEYTIQRAGYSRVYHSFSKVYNSFYAALITGYTRAQLIPHLSKDVICILADSFVTKAEITDLDVGPQMGQWDRTTWTRGVFVKTGIYQLFGADGQVTALRGFQDKSMDCEQVYREALTTGHFDIHMVQQERRRLHKVCVRNSLKLNKRTGSGFWHNHWGAETLTYYSPARGSRVPSIPYKLGAK
jgi:hypothetical protein